MAASVLSRTAKNRGLVLKQSVGPQPLGTFAVMSINGKEDCGSFERFSSIQFRDFAVREEKHRTPYSEMTGKHTAEKKET